jgi:hypothetical protein
MLVSLSRSTAHVKLGERSVVVQGEAFLPGYGSPDFVAYRNSPLTWDTGDDLTEEEREAVFDDLVRSAAERGISIEIE